MDIVQWVEQRRRARQGILVTMLALAPALAGTFVSGVLQASNTWMREFAAAVIAQESIYQQCSAVAPPAPAREIARGLRAQFQ